MLQTSSTTSPMQLLAMTQGLIIHQALYSAARLGVADLLKDGPQTCSDLARTLKVNESALYRILRLLASQSVFEEKVPRTLSGMSANEFHTAVVEARRKSMGEIPNHYVCSAYIVQGIYTVGRDGVLTNIQITSAPKPNLDKAAVQILSQDRYKPATKEDEPVETVYRWQIDFLYGEAPVRWLATAADVK